MRLTVVLAIGAFVLAVFSDWLWFRAGRSYGRNEMIDVMSLHVQPPPAPLTSVGIFFASENSLYDGSLDAGAHVGLEVWGRQNFERLPVEGWTIENLFIDGEQHIVAGVCSETNIPKEKLQRSLQ